jgi:hypothetical protein
VVFVPAIGSEDGEARPIAAIAATAAGRRCQRLIISRRLRTLGPGWILSPTEGRAVLECGPLSSLAIDDDKELSRLIDLHSESVNLRFVSVQTRMRLPRILRESPTVGCGAALLGAAKCLNKLVALAFDHGLTDKAGRVMQTSLRSAGGSFDIRCIGCNWD